jgi:predicted phosphodiesterase
MRYAIISDIHANLEALEAVLLEIRDLKIDQILCCGDILGYYADPNQCMQRLQEAGVHSIVGNHDLAAIGAKDLTTFWSVARKAIEWTRPRLNAAHRTELQRMPKTIEQDDFVIFHGALHIEENPEDFHMTSETDFLATIKALRITQKPASIGFCGHLHKPLAYQYHQGAMQKLPADHIQIKDGASYLFNPGSVGQSRDGDERASFLVYDDRRRSVQFHRVEYDRESTLRKAKREHLLPDPAIVKHTKNATKKLLRWMRMLR